MTAESMMIPADEGRPSWMAAAARFLPQGGSLPVEDWPRRHRVIVAFVWFSLAVVCVYAGAARGGAALRYLPEAVSIAIFGLIARSQGFSVKWRSVAASMGLLTAAAALVDISGGLIEMHFAFFVVVVMLTVYEDWVPFLLAVGFVLLHHGIMGTIDPRAVFNRPQEWSDPWAWAGLHAFFVALAGAAGVTAWRLNEQVRERMRAVQAELERLGSTDPLTGLRNRRRLMADLEAVYEDAGNGALLIFDLNGFKDYNDRFGHPAGDSLLARLAGRLEASVGAVGGAYRLGGDEFCVLARDIGSTALDTLVKAVSEAFTEHGNGFTISASHGAALIPFEARDPDQALFLCDQRMYDQKNSGRATATTQSKNVLLAALSARHADLAEHFSGVASVAERLGRELGMDLDDQRDLHHAAELHDIGKVAIPDSIISKPGPLDAGEWEFMRRHTLIGERILSAAPALVTVGPVVRSSHEHYDGNGYPDGLAGEAIPLAARVIGVCDAYDAMTSPRPYRPTVSHVEAVAELRRCAGTQLDARVVEAFVQAVGMDPVERPGHETRLGDQPAVPVA
jgi:diguanylate cyclase (GGDEF)-like protein